MPTRFQLKKRQILEQLDTPDEQYHDLSPKGSIDEPIRSLISEINQSDGLVTTSSCSGRVSVFLEGRKTDSTPPGADIQTVIPRSGSGGKGGGSWLYISHHPLAWAQSSPSPNYMTLFGLGVPTEKLDTIVRSPCCYIHLKFEPMILHILTESLQDSQNVLTAALMAGFRESGAVSLNATKGEDINPMVAVRSTGYSFDAIIGYQDEKGENIALVNEAYLQVLIGVANERFKINHERISRFRTALLGQYAPKGARGQPLSSTTQHPSKADWEDPGVRRQRKREEGLSRQRQLQCNMSSVPATDLACSVEEVSLGEMFE